jgi:CTP:molybdopterin cytidylyltransferase MocA
VTAVAGLLLAAGAGRRLGRPKALVELDGRTLVERGAQLLLDAGCDPVVVVLGAAADEARGHVPPRASVVVCEAWDEGMGASLCAGLQALAATPAGACVVALVDQPRVGIESVRRLVASVGSDAAVATYDGRPRNPVLLDRAVWPDVAVAAVGDIGARGWLRAHPDRVTSVPCDGTGSPADVDTPEDLARLAPDPTQGVRA